LGHNNKEDVAWSQFKGQQKSFVFLHILVRQSPASFLDVELAVATRPPEKSKINMQRKSSLPANAKVAKFLSSVSTSADTVECDGGW
jgi:uncharacterized lipoprotein YbaY